jgi:hypothetical protein
MDSPTSTPGVGKAGRTGIVGTVVAAFAFFDGVFLGAPIAIVAAAFGSLVAYVVTTAVVICLVVGCCRWIDRRWDEWFSGNGKRIETALEKMRTSNLMRHPVAWIQSGSDRSYAFAAAVANPILVAGLARFIGGGRVGDRRIVLGAIAYAIPYVAMWSLVGFAAGQAVRAV